MGGEHPKASTSESQKRKRPPRTIRVSPKPLACPFVKRYPEKSWPRGCLDGFINTSEVREHLNRRHKTPIYCKRCSRVFTHEFLLKSHDQYDICRERGEPFDTSDYMTDHIWATLRGHRSALNLSEPLKWEVFYDILFPDQPPPSPYASSPSSGGNEQSIGQLRAGAVQMIGSGTDSLSLPEDSTLFEPEESNRDKTSQEAAWEGANKIDSGDPVNFEDFINFEPEELNRNEINQRDLKASHEAAGVDADEVAFGDFPNFEDFINFEDYLKALEAGVDETKQAVSEAGKQIPTVLTSDLSPGRNAARSPQAGGPGSNPLLSTVPNPSFSKQIAAQPSNRIQQGAELTQTEHSDDLSTSTERLAGRIKRRCTSPKTSQAIRVETELRSRIPAVL